MLLGNYKQGLGITNPIQSQFKPITHKSHPLGIVPPGPLGLIPHQTPLTCVLCPIVPHNIKMPKLTQDQMLVCIPNNVWGITKFI